MQATLIGRRKHRVWVGTAIPGAEIPGRHTTDRVVWRDARTGRELARSGRVLDPAPDDPQACAVRDMFELMGTHPRLDTAAIQTVGTKGWDGFAVALVR